MQSMISIRSIARAAGIVAMLSALGAGTVAAHSQTVDPNGNGDGFTKGISNPWAQAHCHAASPEVLASVEAANSFSPADALPCPTIPGNTWPAGLQR